MNFTKNILYFCILAVGSVSAQSFDPAVYEVGRKYPGFVITLKGDTVEGYIEAQNPTTSSPLATDNQNKCFFYKTESDKKPTAKYGPKDIKAYKVGDLFYKSIKYSGGLMNQLNFCVMTSDGRISRYNWYSVKDGMQNARQGSNESWQEFFDRKYTTTMLYQKLENDPIAHDALVISFQKKMGEMIKDYPELAEKVKNKDKGYTVFQYTKIISEYNEYFKNKSK